MKSKFNKSWKSSKQPRKQIKFRANAPNHIKKKLMGSMLDNILSEKLKIKKIGVRKGDEVKVMRGEFKGKKGKVGKADVKNNRIQIEGLQRSKKGGEKVETWFNPSNVKIIGIDEKDKRRFKSKEGSKKTQEEIKQKVEVKK